MTWDYNEHARVFTINNARIPFTPNFAGEARMYNDEGKRNFVVEVDEELYRYLSEQGVRVRVRAPKDDTQETQYLLTIKVYIPDSNDVGRRRSGPEIWMRSEGTPMRQLDNVTCAEIDDKWRNGKIENVDFEFHIGSSSKYPMNPPSAYLDSMVVTTRESRLINRYRTMDTN